MSDTHEHAMPFEVEVEVRSYELDSFDHANHAVFLNWLEHARFKVLEEAGLTYDAMAARGWGVYVVRLEIEYLAEARLGDRLLVRTGAEEPKRSSVVLVQRVVRADDPDTVLARARVTAVWVKEDGRPIRVPEEVRAAFGHGDGAPSA